METQLNLIPASEHPTALESQWLNAISPADFINNNKNFDVLMMKYRCAIREIQTKLEVLDDEFSAVNKRNPISSIKSRVKSPASIYEKLRRRDLAIYRGKYCQEFGRCRRNPGDLPVYQ